jgi:choline dehydrogenase
MASRNGTIRSGSSTHYGPQRQKRVHAALVRCGVERGQRPARANEETSRVQHPHYDYIVVGAGSAGCVLAARLTEDPTKRVLLLEAGPPDRSPWIHLPIGDGKTMWSARYNWCFHTDPDPTMNGRRVYWPRGRTLGGSSSINGLIYIRGQREDYDDWRALGNVGWGYDDVLPYFIRSERNQRGADAYHGDAGPLGVSDIGHRTN